MYFHVCKGDFTCAGTHLYLLHVIVGSVHSISIYGKVFRNAYILYNEDLLYCLIFHLLISISTWFRGYIFYTCTFYHFFVDSFGGFYINIIVLYPLVRKSWSGTHGARFPNLYLYEKLSMKIKYSPGTYFGQEIWYLGNWGTGKWGLSALKHHYFILISVWQEHIREHHS